MVLCRGKKINTDFILLPIYTMDTSGSLFGWASGIWVIIILLFLFMFSGNWFGGFGGNNAAAWLLGNQNRDNNTNNIETLISNNNQWQQQMMAQQQLANQTTLITQWFCNTNSNIEKAMLQAQQNTCQIMQNCTANTQKILDMMCNNTITQLRTDLAEAKLEANNATQTTEIINAIRPFPQSAYIVSSPYTSIYPPATTTTTNG